MYIETDGGRLGFAPNEQLDCTVRAFALVSQISYRDAHVMMAKAGRKEGKRMADFAAFMKTWCGRICNTRYVRRAGDCGITLGRYVKDHPTGRYLLRVRGHVVAVVDGVALDLGEPNWRAIVRGAWCFEEIA